MPTLVKESSALINLLSLQASVEMDFAAEWPIIPKENLHAAYIFLSRVIKLYDRNLNANLTVNEAVLLVVDEFSQPDHKIGLAKVTTMRPNYPVFGWGLLGEMLSCNTPVGDLIQKIRDESLENKIVEVIPNDNKSQKSFFSSFASFFKMPSCEPATKDEVSCPLRVDFEPYRRYGSYE